MSRRVVLVIWDALRPDHVTPEATPHLHRMAQGGTFHAAHHSVFPTCTRVNSASLSTGSFPGRHGMVGNALFLCDVDPRKPVSTANVDTLKAITRATSHHLLFSPTLFQVLRRHKINATIVSTGSGGSAFMWDPTSEGITINRQFISPSRIASELTTRYGELPELDIPNIKQNQFMWNIFADYLLPRMQGDSLMILWLTEPDWSQHNTGLGSPEVMAALRSNDEILGALLCELKSRHQEDSTNILVASDHGVSSIVGNVDVAKMVAENAPLHGTAADLTIVASNEACHGIYIPDHDPRRIRETVEYLQAQPWAGPIFTAAGDGVEGFVPGTFSMRLIRCLSPRSPDILMSMQWDSSPNINAIAGTTWADCPFPVGGGEHGSFSEHDVRSTCIAMGRDFKQGCVSNVPSGVIDLAPTILTLFGVDAPEEWDGRVLSESLQAGPQPDDIQWEQECCRTSAGSSGSAQQQALEIARVHRVPYFRKCSVSKATE